MIDRWKEIEFYFYMRKLLLTYNNIFVLDYIEAICNLAQVDTSSIKVLARQVRTGEGLIVPRTEEVVFIARKLGISYRKLQSDFNISVATQSRYNEDLDRLRRVYAIVERRLPEIEYDNIIKFMKVVKTLKEI